ncbi:MAG: helix-turn-helix transcriptional regulator [Clostridiales bacterium]|nr:helix-turn-helix transcriptional regulator [Clostridiales bacterium]
MKDLEIIKRLIGERVTEEQLKNVDCFLQKNLGLFIPSLGVCGYAQQKGHTHPAYMVVIYFADTRTKISHYPAVIYSPGIPHDDEPDLHYYCIMIEPEFFESQYALYSGEKFEQQVLEFEICSDILKMLNTFAFECSKRMPNFEITLDAHATVITHWIIRSILGESFQMRAISSDYSVARAQHFMEQHYSEKITVKELAELGYMSVSSLNRKFKKETDRTPMEYLIELRIEKSKKMLRRRNTSMADIAIHCGFNTSAHFSACFYKHTGKTPSEYQSRYVE